MTTTEEMKSAIVETTDENGNLIKFEVLDIITFEEQDYAVLAPIEGLENESEEEEIEAVVMKILEDGDDYLFENIEDDVEFEKVLEYIESLENIEE